MKSLLIGLAAGLAAIATSAVAGEEKKETMMEKAVDLGPAVGASIPHSLSSIDSEGKSQDFASLTGDKGVALFFVRSLDWCPFCQLQTLDVNHRKDEFETKGYNVVFVSYDTPEEQALFKKKRRIDPAILSDQESEIIKAFGLLNEGVDPESSSYGIPHPAVFIVSKDKKVAAKLYEDDYLSNNRSYRNRPDVDVILEAIDGI